MGAWHERRTGHCRNPDRQSEPVGKLPITIPKSAGQLPMYYYQTRSRYTTGYSFGTSRDDERPAFCFGHGLSYTTFSIEDADTASHRITEGNPADIRLRDQHRK